MGTATAEEWPNTHTPAPLLEAVDGQASDRKLRLFACACCRRAWDSLSELDRRGLAVAEHYADGAASEEARWASLRVLLEDAGADVHHEVGSLSWAVVETGKIPSAVVATLLNETEVLICGHTGRAIRGTCQAGMSKRAIWTAHIIAEDLWRQQLQAKTIQNNRIGSWRRIVQRLTGTIAHFGLDGTERRFFIQELRVQADLVRDIFGNPFRPVTFSPSWHTDTAVTLARQMYESRDFSAMPILADALQDAGCDNDDILTHCRDPKQPHVRGCWVVDLVLGRE